MSVCKSIPTSEILLGVHFPIDELTSKHLQTAKAFRAPNHGLATRYAPTVLKASAVGEGILAKTPRRKRERVQPPQRLGSPQRHPGGCGPKPCIASTLGSVPRAVPSARDGPCSRSAWRWPEVTLILLFGSRSGRLQSRPQHLCATFATISSGPQCLCETTARCNRIDAPDWNAPVGPCGPTQPDSPGCKSFSPTRPAPRRCRPDGGGLP